MAGNYLLQALDYADPGNLGGASRVALSLGEELQELGWKIVIFAGCKGREGLSDHKGFSLCHFPSLPNEEKTLFSTLDHMWRPHTVLRRFVPREIKLVASHQPFVTWNIRRLLDSVPMVYFFHSPWPGEYAEVMTKKGGKFFIGFTIRLLFERWALRRAKLIIVGSEFMRERLFFYHGRNRFALKIHKLPFGVDTDFFKPQGNKPELRRSLGLPVRSTILLTVRRLEDRMGLKELLEAFKLCAPKYPDLFLVVVGKGSLKEELKVMAYELGISSSVLFWGYAEEEKLPMIYTASDLFVLPTQELEGFGLVILEALACDIPVVATPVGGIPGVMGEFGQDYLTAGTSVKDIAEKVSAVLNRPGQVLRKNCFRDYVLKNYSWRKYAETFIEKTKDLI